MMHTTLGLLLSLFSATSLTNAQSTTDASRYHHITQVRYPALSRPHAGGFLVQACGCKHNCLWSLSCVGAFRRSLCPNPQLALQHRHVGRSGVATTSICATKARQCASCVMHARIGTASRLLGLIWPGKFLRRVAAGSRLSCGKGVSPAEAGSVGGLELGDRAGAEEERSAERAW